MKFKTLKDLKEAWKPIIVNENDLQKMEHIELSMTGELIPLEVVEGDLKQEAIKLIKEDDYYEFIKLFPFKILNWREVTVLKDFVKWNLNITKENLK